MPYASLIQQTAGVHAPWVGDLPWPPPENYAMKIDSHSDSCDGMAGTFGWDPVIVQLGIQWTGSGARLMARITKDFGKRGFARVGQIPEWDTDGGGGPGVAWISQDSKVGPIILTLSNPGPVDPSLPTTNHQWVATVEAKPTLPPPTGC